MGDPFVMPDSLYVEEWKNTLAKGIGQTLRHFGDAVRIDAQHIRRTPERYVKALEELFAGCYQVPENVLSTVFQSDVDMMIHVKETKFFSICAHHVLIFHGTAHFAYIPNGKIVGLSKIPRLIDMYARRPQVQEELASQIVESFSEIVQPLGCGIFIQAEHFCCSARGAKQATIMETTALRGNFKEASVKSEFLQSAHSSLGR